MTPRFISAQSADPGSRHTLLCGDGARTCVRCGNLADLLVFEPDGWLCRPCADELGREAVKDSLEIFT